MTRVPITIAVFAMCVPLRVHADEATGKVLAREGEELAKQKQYVAAAAKFREAYAADPTAEYLCNIGVAYHKAKTEQPRAHLFLTRCQERATVLEPKFVAAVNTALTTVDRDLRAGAFTPIEITVEPETSTVAISAFAIDEAFIGPRAIWLQHGHHVIRFTAEGYVAKTVEVDATTRERQTIAVTLEREPVRVPDVIVDAGSGSADPGPGSGSAIVTRPPPPPVVPQGPKPTKLLPIGASVATVAFMITASLSYGRAQGRAQVAAFAITPEVFQADKDYIARHNQYTFVSASLALVGASVSTFLWYRALREPRARIEVDASASGASISVGGRF